MSRAYCPTHGFRPEEGCCAPETSPITDWDAIMDELNELFPPEEDGLFEETP